MNFMSKLLLLIVLPLAAQNCWAVKPSTHVFLAQEIIDELKENDGQLIFPIVNQSNNEQIKVELDSAQVDAILKNQYEFRAGSIGPDASPDIAIGQMFVHPGTPLREDGVGYQNFGADENWNNAWSTNDWIRYLDSRVLNNNEKAYMDGVRIHAATDMISHTYVNTYSGNSFRILQHMTDPLAELRHILVEGFIDHFTPNLPVPNLQYKDSVRLPKIDDAVSKYEAAVAEVNFKLEEQVSRCYQLYRELMQEEPQYAQRQLQECISIANELFNSDDIPTVDESKQDFIHRVFMYDKQTVAECVAEDVDLTGPGDTVIHKVRLSKVMKQLSQDVSAKHFNSIYELRYQIEEVLQSKWLDQIDTDVMKHIIYWWTDQQPDILLDGLSQRLQDIAIEQAMEIKEVADEINTVIGKTTLRHNEFVIDEVKKIENAMAKVGQLNRSILSMKQRIDNIVDDLDDKVCKWTTPHWLCKKIKRLKRELRGLESAVLEKTNELLHEKNLMSQALEKVQALLKGLYYVNQDLNGESNPVRALLRNWAEGIDGSMSRYSDVGLGMMISTMDPDQAMLDPLKKWAFEDCDFQRLIGLESDEGPGCLLQDKLEKIQESLNFLFDIVIPGGDPLLATIKREIENKIKEKIENKLQQVKDDLNERLDAKMAEAKAQYPEFVAMYNILNDVYKVSNLAVKMELVFNKKYYQDSLGLDSDYLSIDQVALKLMREMRVSEGTHCNGKDYCFQPNEYPLFYNALMMSKLALLDSAELRVLAQKLNQTQGALQIDEGLLASRLNIIDQSVLSIDGNHHWLGENVPPYIAKNGFPRETIQGQAAWRVPLEYDNVANTERPYATGGNDEESLMFGSKQNTNALLNKLFKGPLNEMIFDPSNVPTLSNLNLATYFNKVNEAVSAVNATLAENSNEIQENFGLTVRPIEMSFDSLFNGNSGQQVQLNSAYLSLYNECTELPFMFWIGWSAQCQ